MDILYANQALMALLTTLAILAAADFGVATALAVARGQFAVSLLAEWCQTHLAARVVPIAIVAILGANDAALFGIAVAAAGTYAAETLASIKGNLLPNGETTEDV